MKRVIPEQIIYSCDRCGDEIKESAIDCRGTADFVGRDFSGAAVGGNRKTFELCSVCSMDLDRFLSNLIVEVR